MIAVAPPQLQIQMLNAIKFAGNKGVLLQPLTNRVANEQGKVEFQYCGLNQVHRVEIITTLLAGVEPLPAHLHR